MAQTDSSSDAACAAGRGDEKDLFEVQFKLLLAEKTNTDLELQLRDANSRNGRLEDRVRELESDSASRAGTEPGTLRTVMEEKENGLRAAKQGAMAVQQGATRARDEIAILQNKLTQAVEQVNQLTAKLLESEQTAEKNAEDADLHKVKLDNVKYEREELKEKVASLIADRDRYVWAVLSYPEGLRFELRYSEPFKIMREALQDPPRHVFLHPLQHANISTRHRQPQSGALQSEIDRLKGEKETFQELMRDTAKYIANLVTELDLAKQGTRVFNCQHEDLRHIADDQNSTRSRTAATIAFDMYKEWSEKEDFMKAYNASRQELLRHHRAHERANNGRGVASWFLKKMFTGLDEKRGVHIAYK
jgi:chromosome segregation ATPase